VPTKRFTSQPPVPHPTSFPPLLPLLWFAARSIFLTHHFLFFIHSSFFLHSSALLISVPVLLWALIYFLSLPKEIYKLNQTLTMGNRNNKVASNETNYKGDPKPDLPSPVCFFSSSLSHTGKKFNKCYMLARELGSGAFSVVKLGVNKVMPHSPSLPPSPLCSVAHPFSHRKLVKMLQSKLFRKRNYLMRIWLHFIQKLKFYQGSITLTSSSLPSLLSPSLPSESSTTPLDHLHSFSSLPILLS
jgi:hypothetical protein